MNRLPGRSSLSKRSCPEEARPGAVVGLLLASLLLLGPPALHGQEAVPSGLTVYSQNLALVRADIERVLEPGVRTVRVEGLPSNIDAGSLFLPEPGVSLLGVRGRRTYQAAGEGSAVSLVLDLDVGARVDDLAVAYLTGGMSWNAGYTMVVAPDDASARIDGYATISNGSGAAYDEAEVQLLAGTVNVRGGGAFAAMDQLRTEAAMRQAAAPGISGGTFSGYQLYEVDEPLSLRAGESRRIRLLGAARVPVRREYILPGQVNYYQSTSEPQRQEAFIRYRMERAGDGDFFTLPLPAGPVQIFQPDAEGRVQLLGVDSAPNTPAREELLLTVGQAFDIGGTRVQTDYERPGGSLYESAWEVELTNRNDEAVVVQVVERIQGDWEILESSHNPVRLSASLARFDVRVPADGESTLTYRVRIRN